MSNLTLGSLFDGSGGFPLAGLLSGITPLWASEVEPFPIRVTTKRLPRMQHFGDINKINGASVPPVDIITGGFCCQDLSVAGKRAGLHGERSGLFFQIIRIIKEMRAATDGAYPKYAVLENVPGMYSSGGGTDFLEVLNELIKIKDETASIPMPESGKWSTAGEIVGDGFSLGWRTLDAQFWGVAQRRRRCYIVVDFTSESAGKILFDESRLSGNPAPCKAEGQRAAVDTAEGTGTAGTYAFEPGACSRLGKHASFEKSNCLRAWMGDNQTAVAIPVNTQVGLREHKNDGTGLGVGGAGDPAYTIQAAHSHAVAIENRPQDSRIKIKEDGIVQTLDARMGEGGGNVPLVMNERQYDLTIGTEVANTLTGTDYKGTQVCFEPKTLKIRSGCEGGGKGALVQDNKSATLSTSNDQTVFVPKATVYGICSLNSNAMKSSNPHSGCYEADTARTLDTTNPCPSKNAGGMAVVALEGNGSRPSHNGSGVSAKGVSFSLNTIERHAVCYQEVVGTLDCGLAKQNGNQIVQGNKMIVEQITVENHQHSGYREVNTAGTLKQAGGTNGGGSENMVVEKAAASFYPQMKAESQCYREDGTANTLVNGTNSGFQNGIVTEDEACYIVRRLTPLECCRLQGFPDYWCAGLETPDPTEDEISFWEGVFETQRNILGKSTKPKSRKQILKWLQNPYSDSAEYKMWGNGICLQCAVFVLGGIANIRATAP
ncbi:MAG: putative BsuMI modification methylase subunit YdiP [Firmicutes bacterium ADurb.Bin193]|nr:MAG: putative BsuMI modification methylase subunit YdiP [Firmicutes bacterium ADurb.Bin193]